MQAVLLTKAQTFWCDSAIQKHYTVQLTGQAQKLVEVGKVKHLALATGRAHKHPGRGDQSKSEGCKSDDVVVSL